MLRRLLTENPRELQAIVALGIFAAETGRADVAVTQMLEALDVDPRCVPALCWLCFLLLQEGRPDEAGPYAERAVGLDPRNPATQAAMGRSLLHQRMPAEAVPYLQASAELDPNNALVLFELAEALQSSGRWQPAAEVLRKAVLLAPDPNWLVRLAYLELRTGQMVDAERYAKRALAKDPGLTGAHVVMARIFTERLMLEDAEASWQKAEQLNPPPGFLNLERALALSAIGHFEEALKELERSIDENPHQGGAYQALFYAKRVTASDLPMVRRIEGLLDTGTPPPIDQVSLLFALGKAYDNLSEYETAIQYFDRANALNKSLSVGEMMDRGGYRDRVDQQITFFTKDTFTDCRYPRSDSSLPVLVVGMMRSGTSLTEQLLTCHPQMGGAGEQGYWALHDNEIVDYNRRRINPTALKTCADEYVSLLKSISPGYPYVIDKNPANLNVLGSFHLAFPNARVLHIRRNAVDTALSIWMTPMVTTAEFVSDRENIVFAYKEYLRLMEHWRVVLPPDRFLEVAYEDLVEMPEIYVRRLIEFVGLEWTDACLRPELNERRVRTPSFWQVRQPLFKSSTKRWQRYEPWLGAFEELRGL